MEINQNSEYSSGIRNDDSLNNKQNNDQIQIVESEQNLQKTKLTDDDHIISIKHSCIFKIPYFNFGRTTHFYFCCSRIKKKQYKLSEIPHPYFTLGPGYKNFLGIIIFCFIFLLGISIAQIIYLKLFLKFIGLSINFLFFAITFWTYASNPGTVYTRKSNENLKYCKSCNYSYPYNPKLNHCCICGICIINVDHHCDVFGKCIAKNNIFCFYFFLFGFFIIIFETLGTFVYILAFVYNY